MDRLRSNNPAKGIAVARAGEESREKLTSGMSLSNLADRLKAQKITGPAMQLNIESATPSTEKSADKLPKE